MRSQNGRSVVLSNGNLHDFWDLERGNPCTVLPPERYARTEPCSLTRSRGYDTLSPERFRAASVFLDRGYANKLPRDRSFSPKIQLPSLFDMGVKF